MDSILEKKNLILRKMKVVVLSRSLPIRKKPVVNFVQHGDICLQGTKHSATHHRIGISKSMYDDGKAKATNYNFLKDKNQVRREYGRARRNSKT
jgi:hypothetical protein